MEDDDADVDVDVISQVDMLITIRRNSADKLQSEYTNNIGRLKVISERRNELEELYKKAVISTNEKKNDLENNALNSILSVNALNSWFANECDLNKNLVQKKNEWRASEVDFEEQENNCREKKVLLSKAQKKLEKINILHAEILNAE